MIIKRSIKAILMAGCAICSLPIGAAHAQTTAAQTTASKPDDAQEAATLEDIVVTAQFRSENLQKTPVAVTALSERTLSDKGIDTSEALSGVVPSFRVGEGSREIQFTIRGITAANVGPAQDAPVAVYLNGVYLTRPSFIGSAFFDMERVEVLRGPQGTLFGRNATGGAVNYITAKPVDSFEGALELSKGNYDATNIKGMINIPLNDDLAIRVAALYANHDGYLKAPFLVGSIASQDLNAQRFEARYRPTSKLELMLELNNYASTGVPSQTDIVKTATYTPSGRRGAHNTPFKADQHGFGATFQASYDLDFAQFVSISGYRNDFVRDSYDRDYSRGLTSADRWNRAKAVSQEFRLVSSGDKKLSYIFGLYYYKGDNEDNNNIYSTFDRLTGTASRAPQVGAMSYAAYVQPSFKITDTLKLTGGFRYSIDKKNIEGRYTSSDVVNATNLVLTPGTIDSNKWSTPTWKVGLDWDITPDNFFYASISTGWKAGGLNSVANPLLQRYDPETITAYEIGSKNEFFDGRLRLNLNAFYYDYKDLQFNTSSTFDGGKTISRIVLNGGTARIYGAEMETVALVTDDFQVEANLSYLPVAKYLSLTAYLDTMNGNNNSDLTGRRMPNTPKLTLNLAPSYTVEAPGGKVRFRADFQYTSYQVFTPYGSAPYVNTTPAGVRIPINNNIYANATQPGYTRTSLSIRYDNDKDWYAELYARNLEDNQQLEAVVFNGVSGSGGFTSPRTYGVTMGARFR